jgi:hypothetical protein
MSFQLMAWAVTQTTGSCPRKAVLVTLADHANAETGECYPSIERIARQAELSESAVKSALRALVEQGLIARERRRRGDGSLASYSYTFPGAALAWGERRETPDQRRETPVGLEVPPAPEPGIHPEPGEGVLHPSATPRESSPPAAWAAHAPSKVDRKSVTEQEAEASWAILEAWNRETGQSLRAKDWLAKIIMRLREHPELGVAQHAALIRHALSDPWWRGAPSPSVIYGNSAIFEKTLAASKTDSLAAFHDHAQDAVERARRRHAG